MPANEIHANIEREPVMPANEIHANIEREPVKQGYIVQMCYHQSVQK